MKILLANGLLHGRCMTITGPRSSRAREGARAAEAGQEVIRPFDDPMYRRATGDPEGEPVDRRVVGARSPA